MSINAHYKKEQSRRDDLEAIGYLLVYLAKGSLPWQSSMADKKKDDNTPISETKFKMPIDELCKGCDSALAEYLKYCKKLKFDETPDYKRIRKMFLESLYSKCDDILPIYDWMIISTPEKKKEPVNNDTLMIR